MRRGERKGKGKSTPPGRAAAGRRPAPGQAAGRQARKGAGAGAADLIQALFRLPFVGIAISEPEGRILEANPALATLLGYRSEELLERTLEDLTHPDDRALEAAELQRLLSGEADGYMVTKRFLRADGAVLWATLAASCVREGDGGVRCLITLVKDVTGPKRVEEELRTHQRRLDLAMRAGQMGLWELDLTNGGTWRTPQHDRLFGYEDLQPAWGEEEALRHVVPEDHAVVRGALDAALASGRLLIGVRVQPPGKALRWIELDGRVVRDAAGRPVRVSGVVHDVTERKRAEQAVRDSERLYRAIGESIDYGVWVCAPDGRNTYASESFLRLVGQTQEECSNFGWGDVLHPDDAERTLAAWKECVRTQGTWDIEHRYRGVDGEWHPILARGVPVKDENGKILCWAGINLDVSGIRNAEKALRESQERLRLVLEGSDDGYWDWHVATNRVVGSRRLRDILGLPGEGPESEFGAEEWWFRVHPDDLPATRQAMLDFAAGRARTLEVEYRIAGAGGEVRWVRARGSAVERDAGGRPLRAAGIVTDVTHYNLLAEEREQALAALGRSERMYRTIAHYFPNGLLALYDRDLRIQVVDGTTPATGMDPSAMVGKVPADVTPPELLPTVEGAYREALRGGTGTATLRIGARTFELVTHPVRDEKGDVVMGLLMTQEVTDRLAMETRLATSARLSALGTLVAGVAHEINNPLASAIADGWLAIRELEAARSALGAAGRPDVEGVGRRIDTALEALHDAQDGERRITRIVADLSLFGRQGASREPVRLADVVTEALRWAHATVSPVADVRVEADEVPPVLGAAGQLGQVVVNLLTNAAQAIPEGRRGTITVRVGRGVGETVRLEVADDGRGIAPEELKRIFDPFFTTREVGTGMGLGLPICHALVTAHGGTISASSEPGRGSTFRVELPAAPVQSGSAEPGAGTDVRGEPARQSMETSSRS